jgi:hypothetical protein
MVSDIAINPNQILNKDRVALIFSIKLDPEYEGRIFLRNTGNHTASNEAALPRRLDTADNDHSVTNDCYPSSITAGSVVKRNCMEHNVLLLSDLRCRC